MRYLKRAIQDIRTNRFLHAVTIITIALSILIVSSFALFFVNTSDIMNLWKKGIRIMVYLNPGVSEADRLVASYRIKGFTGVQHIRYIPKEEALKQLKGQMKRQAGLFENLQSNPLPDAFEVKMDPSAQDWQSVEKLASLIESLEFVDEVEYGQRWLARVTNVFNLFRLTGFAMGGLFFMAAVFIVANTTRLMLYSRQGEVEIMRLVGATDRFIKTPFYIEGIIHGGIGGGAGLCVLFVLFMVVSSRVDQSFFSGLFQIRFLSPGLVLAILLTSMLVGWIGCYLSLKQFLRG